ncbi:hypothetical protein B0H11DRAFT_2249427 [Mycena galericulata]|nr:hypothetical protein B0H11DRAFT_2249427 [Mycena galericulata]
MISPPSAEIELGDFLLDQHYYDSDDEYDDEYIMDLGSEDFSRDSHLESPSAFSHPIARNITAPLPTPQKPSNPAISEDDWTHAVTHLFACISLLVVFWRVGSKTVGA